MKKVFTLIILLSISYAQDFDYSNMSETEKIMMYNSMKKSTAAAVFLEMFVPTVGYGHTDNWNRGFLVRGIQLTYIYLGISNYVSCYDDEPDYYYYYEDCDSKFINTIIISSLMSIFAVIDAGMHVSKYNNEKYRQIFGKEASNLGFNLYPLQDGAGISLTYSFN